jgi:peroxiredoxin
MLLLVVGAGLVCVIAGAVGWLAFQTMLQNGRILLRIERLEEETRLVRQALAATSWAEDASFPDVADAIPPGWPPGSVVPDFELPTLDGGSLTLWEWRGRDVVLLFFDAACGPSRELFARVGPLRVEEGGPRVLLIGTGDPARAQAFVEAHGLQLPTLVQERHEVAELLRTHGTPAAYRVDAFGKTVGERALGVAAVLELLRQANVGLVDADLEDLEVNGERDDFTPLSRSALATHSPRRLTGLRPGEPAPAFRLPDLDGAEHPLDEFVRAERPLLLVFTDPHCAPCRATLPELERVHRARAQELQVVAISRGGREANLAHVRGLTFPVLLQRRWEASRAYATYATPAGYLIDADGIIASRPAVGRKAILRLAEGVRPNAGSPPAERTPA